MNTYEPLAIANTLIGIASNSDNPVTHLKLQKLVYYSHGWWLALADQPLFLEHIKAWDHGPVVVSLWHRFKHYGSSAISLPEPDFEPEKEIKIPQVEEGDSTMHAFLEKIFEVYGGYDPFKLSTMTHKEGTPWAVTKARARDKQSVTIPNDLIKEYFTRVRMGKAAEVD